MGQRGLADLLGARLEPGTRRARKELVCLSERLVWSSVEIRMESDSEVKLKYTYYRCQSRNAKSLIWNDVCKVSVSEVTVEASLHRAGSKLHTAEVLATRWQPHTANTVGN